MPRFRYFAEKRAELQEKGESDSFPDSDGYTTKRRRRTCVTISGSIRAPLGDLVSEVSLTGARIQNNEEASSSFNVV